MGKRLLVLFLIAFCLGFVSGQPPFQQSPTESGYLIIETGYPSSHKINEDYYIHTHVYNGTTSLLVKSGISCYYHFYNHNLKGGEHIDTGILTLYGDGYYNYTSGNLINETGEYSVLIWCNSSTEGGFFKYTFDAVYTGKTINSAQAILYSAFFFILVFVFIMVIFGIQQLPSDNERDEEGKILSITYLKYLRNVLWFFEWMLFIGILYLSSNLAFAYLHEELFAQILFVLFRVSFGITPVIVIVWLIWIFVSMFHDRQMQQILNRGMFPQGRL